MKNLLNYITETIRHNRGMFISIILMMIFSLWFLGCPSKTTSIIDPIKKVTEDELNIEYTAELSRLENEMQVLKSTTEIRLQDLHRQDKFKQGLYENAKLIVDNNNPNPLGLLSLIGTIFGIGAVIDNRKKDGLIKGLLASAAGPEKNADNKTTLSSS
jgi:hypothetical protein